MRADIQHEVGHDAKKKLQFLPRFQHIRRWPPTSAGKSRCLPVNGQRAYVHMHVYIYIYMYKMHKT